MPLTQETRQIAVTTPLGEDVLALTSFSGQEEMSRLFSYQLEMASNEDSIAAKDIVGKNVTLKVRLADDSFRFFNGLISRFTTDYGDDSVPVFRAEMVPWLWFLTQTSDCRIFQEKTVQQIIEQIFGDLGFSDFQFDLNGSYQPLEYCVQYRETDYNFVARLMEQVGMFFYFKHEDGKHELVIGDHTGNYADLPENEVRSPTTAGSQIFEDHITSWSHQFEFISGKWAQTDYNFKTPSTNLMSQTGSVVKLPGISKYEVYDFPGEFPDKGIGGTETKVRMEQEESAYDVVNGTSTCRTFTPGGKFTLTEHPADEEAGKSYVITAIRHSATEQAGYTTGGGGSGVTEYTNSFSCIPDSVVFRPARITPKPLVSGGQTAVVVGPSGEEIWCDEHGRVKVQFHWDREGKQDDKSSCWIRCSHNIAGEQWGFVVIPRIGQEVVIHFLEGDPDRPLIVGCVYNANNMPPYELPANKTQSGFKSRSSKGGGSGNFNEIRFEDQKGSEEVYFHAEKDMNTVIENDETRDVGHDRRKSIGRDEETQVERNRTESVGKDETISIGGDRKETVKKDETIGIDGKRTTNIGKDEKITIAGKRTENVAKDEEVEVSKNRTHRVGDKDLLSVGKELGIVAGDKISFKTGSASITLTKNGKIVIKGKDIIIQGSGKINIKASKDVTIKGSKIKEN